VIRYRVSEKSSAIDLLMQEKIYHLAESSIVRGLTDDIICHVLNFGNGGQEILHKDHD
jgi:hypothetical protein